MKKFILLFLICTLTSTSSWAKTYNWRIAQSWEKDSLFSEAVNRFAEVSQKLSNGRIKITVDTQENLKNSASIFDMVQKGQYEMGHSDSSYWRKVDRNTLFFSSVPFGMITPELYSWFYHGGGMDLMKKVYSKHGLLSFPGGNTGSQMVGWFRREVKCIEGLRGITMRMTGLGGEVMRNVGVNVVDTSVDQLYPKLNSGELDAVGFIGPAVDFKLGFYKIAPYYYTGWNAPSSEMQFLVNQQKFDQLPDDLQKVIVAAMRLAAYDLYTKTLHENSEKLALIKKDFPNIKFRSFPSDVIRTLHRESTRLVQDIVDQGDGLTKEIVSSMEQYSRNMRSWTRIADQAYLNNSAI